MTQLYAPPAARRRVPKGLIITFVVVAALACGVCGGVVWWRAHQAAVAAAADEAAGNQALRDARQDIDTLNTMDYRATTADLQAWLGATTGTLNGQLTQGRAGLEEQFRATRLITSGTVTAARVVSADSVRGTATILGTEDVNVSLAGTNSVRHNGFRADLVRTAAGWRLNTFTTTAIN